jgi:hypothetical protein
METPNRKPYTAAGGSSESELTNGGGCAVRRRLTLDSHWEGDEEDEAGVGEDDRPQPQLPCAWRRSNTQECAQAADDVAELDHCSDSGAEARSPCVPEFARSS